jgi:hypothetical protein
VAGSREEYSLARNKAQRQWHGEPRTGASFNRGKTLVCAVGLGSGSAQLGKVIFGAEDASQFDNWLNDDRYATAAVIPRALMFLCGNAISR